MRSASDLREAFLRFFEERAHTRVPSSSLVPAGDPTLLFTNAGMVQFKDVFLGLEGRPYTRAATAQKCMRVAGKHNDLEEVGPSPWHHTFFEMLGNFSFGDYFKRDAIAYAWAFVTERLGVEASRLVFTVFRDDDEAYAAWREIAGVRPDQILRMDEKTNFWSMADAGPCGPTSELHFDWGPERCTCGQPNCSVALDNGCARWLEIWNLVFMQYDQRRDGTRVALPRPGVDTGMGLERMTSVLQGVPITYDTDLFTPILDRVQRLLRHSDAERRGHLIAYRVLADHARATAFLIADGVLPGNEGRAYVLRMIIRRAIRFARQAGAGGGLLGQVVPTVVETMEEAYPELRLQAGFIEDAVRAEEQRFQQTLQSGLGRLDELIASVRARGERTIPGEEVFRLYDTHGFPREMTRDVAVEHGLEIDWPGFERAMAAQRERARAGGSFRATGEATTYAQVLAEVGPAVFVGYDATSADTHVVALLRDGRAVEEAHEGDDVELVLASTPFYAEAGGQVADVGEVIGPDGHAAVADVQRPVPGLVVHRGRIAGGVLRAGDEVAAAVDEPRRRDIMRNHTATHLLHRALRDVLGERARQAGSLVAPDRLRFDVQHLQPLSDDQRRRVEEVVNERVLDALPVVAAEMPYRDAVGLGATALFGEKYGDVVRVVSIDDYSRELCGGTHLANTSQVGLFRITAEGSVAAGVRRIEAVTGRGAYARTIEQEELIERAAAILGAPPTDVPSQVARIVSRVRDLERQVERVPGFEELHLRWAEVSRDPPVFYGFAQQASPDELRRQVDLLHGRHPHSITIVASGNTGQGLGAVVAKVSGEFADLYPAGRVAASFAEAAGGRGGGSRTFGRGGGLLPDTATAIDEQQVREIVRRARR